jgi:hypothetical protein
MACEVGSARRGTNVCRWLRRGAASPVARGVATVKFLGGPASGDGGVAGVLSLNVVARLRSVIGVVPSWRVAAARGSAISGKRVSPRNVPLRGCRDRDPGVLDWTEGIALGARQIGAVFNHVEADDPPRKLNVSGQVRNR